MELALFLLVCSTWDWYHQRVPGWVCVLAMGWLWPVAHSWGGFGLGIVLPWLAGMAGGDQRVLGLVGAVVGAPALAVGWTVAMLALFLWGRVRRRPLMGVPFLPWFSVVQFGVLVLLSE